MKRVTVSELLDAIEKNGYKQTFGTLMRNKDGSRNVTSIDQIGEACALGQGMANLNITSLSVIDGKIEWFSTFVNRVTYLNDNEKLPVDKIAQQLRIEYVDVLDSPIFEAREFGERYASSSSFSMR